MIDFDASSLVSGIRELTSDIEGIFDEGSLRRIGFAGAEVFRDEAKRNAARNVKTGTLYRNIIAKRLPEESDGANRQAYLVTVRSGKFNQDGDAFYWRFVEYGHKFVPRNKTISKRTGKTIGWAAHRRAAELEYGTATAPAYPFMRPAYESKKVQALNAMDSQLDQEMAKTGGGT